MRKILPFLISLCGIASDYITTQIGLSLGFYELNPQYHPLKALLLFWGISGFLSFSFRNQRKWRIAINLLMFTSWFGGIHNLLKIFFVF